MSLDIFTNTGLNQDVLEILSDTILSASEGFMTIVSEGEQVIYAGAKNALTSNSSLTSVEGIYAGALASNAGYYGAVAGDAANFLKGSGLGLMLGLAVAKIVEAPDDQKASAILKQSTLAAVSLYGTNLLTAYLTGSLTATVLGGAALSPVLALPIAAILVGTAVVILDKEWDNISSFIASQLPENVVSQAALIEDTVNTYINGFTAWVDETGTSALNTLSDINVESTIDKTFGFLNTILMDSYPQDGVEKSVGYFTNLIASLTSTSLASTDPIVLDLAGTGIELTSIDDSNAHFDLHGTGFAVHTGWVGPNTGILVNPNPNGTVTSINNLFGNSSTDGFTAMSAIDTDHNGKLDVNDSAYYDLRVWVDANGNGVVNSGELKTLSQLDITSISLDASPTNQIINGNVVSALAHYTRSDNTTGQVAEAFFNNNQLASTYTGTYTLNPEVLLLPNQRGYGTLPDLFIAMSLDPTLLGMVKDFMQLTSMADADAQIQDIIYRWANVENVSATGRGTLVNGQHLAVLEAVIGHPWVDNANRSDPLDYRQAVALERAYTVFAASVRAHLIAQGPLSSYFDGLIYNYANDSITGTVDFNSAVTAFASNQPTMGTLKEKADYWINSISMMDFISGELGTSINDYDAALQTVLSSAGLPSTLNAIHNIHYVTSTDDGNGNNIFDLTGNAIYGAIVEGLPTGNNVMRGVDNLADAVFINMNAIENYSGELTLSASQLASFDTLTSAAGTTNIYATTSGVYDLRGKNLTGNFVLNARYADGPVTFFAPDTDSVLSDGVYYEGGVVTTMTGGTGNDIFYVNHGLAGSSYVGGSGTDTLQFGMQTPSGYADITDLNISGIEIMELSRDVKVNASQLAGFNTIHTYGGTIYAGGAGTYNFATKSIDSAFTFNAMEATGNITAVGSNVGMTMYTSYYAGTNSFTGGSGADLFYIVDGLATATINGGLGNDTLATSKFDISDATVSNVETLMVFGDVKLTASQLAGFKNIVNAEYSIISASSAGTYDIGTRTSSTTRLSSVLTSANVTMKAGVGSSTFYDGSGNNTYIGGGAANDYYFTGYGGQDIIQNSGTGSVAKGYVHINSNTYDQLWFERVGNDLQIDMMGTTDNIKLKNWFSNTASKTQEIYAGYDSMHLNTSHVSALVSAMASFKTSNSSFDPTLVGVMPTNTALQNAITANWQAN